MPNVELLLWNMEWMDLLFVSGGERDPAEFRPDREKPRPTTEALPLGGAGTASRAC